MLEGTGLFHLDSDGAAGMHMALCLPPSPTGTRAITDTRPFSF